jgi:hypothetical protein
MKRNLLFYLILFGLSAFSSYAQTGCTDSLALNYDSTATIDDGSCYFDTTVIHYGCTDSVALNFDPNVSMDDGSCYFDTILEVHGCMNLDAINFDSLATIEDGSCYFDTTIVHYGCTDSVALNFDPNASMDDGSCYFDTIPEVHGCMNLDANNFDSLATIDDGSCHFDTTVMIYGCMDVTALNFNPMANEDGGNCVFDSIPLFFGCIDTLAANYDSSATVNDGSCEIRDSSNHVVVGDVFGCTNYYAVNYLLEATIDNGSCQFTTAYLDTAMVINGCLDVEALTYNAVGTNHLPSMCIYSQDTVMSQIELTELVLDTASITEMNCEIDYSILIDSATIASTTITGNDLEVLWEVWQRGVSFSSNVVYQDVTLSGDLLLYLTIDCIPVNGERVNKTNSTSRTLRAVAKKSTTLGIDTYVASQVIVFPNPIAGNTISISTGEFVVDYVTITDMTGETVISTEVFSANVNVEKLPSGTYVISLYNAGVLLNSELIIK